jgi:hypothetical protein
MTTPMSFSGSPSTATMSARKPGAMAPRCFSRPSILAGIVVAVASACAGVMPAFTNHSSSRVF